MADFKWEYTHSARFNGFDVAPKELTRLLGLKPSLSLAVGEPRGPGIRRVAKVSVWTRDTKIWKGTTEDVNESRHLRGLERLVKEMHQRRKIIAKLIPPGEFFFYTTIYTDSPNVIVSLPSNLSRLIADLNADYFCSVWGTPRLQQFLDDGKKKRRR